MLSLAGNYLLLFSLFCFIAAIIFRYPEKIYLFYLASAAPILAFSLLLYGFITSDLSLKNVFFNSDTTKPLLYKIAASWASHEGSILLWLSLLSLSCIIYVKMLKLPDYAKAVQISILAFIEILFGSFVYITSNPFDKFNFVPKEGLGLNPMLQDIALSIHPPLLYLGNVVYIVLFTNACLILFYPEHRKQILLNSKIFSSFGLMSLSVGIGLGSWWAYRELGWGGFWFFDPVENISLLPWLSGIALHHFLIISLKSDKYLRMSVALSFIPFILSIYGIFFVRSGIISSIHTFAFSADRGLYIFSICTILTILSILLFLKKKNNLIINTSIPTNKEKTIFVANNLWLLSIISLLIAIIYPVYYSYIYKIDISIDLDYFKIIFIPIHIPIMLLAAITPFLPNNHYKKHLLFCLITCALIMMINNKVELKIISGGVLFSSIYLMIQMVHYFLASKLKLKELALFLGHFGFGLLAFSITINSLMASEISFIGNIGDKIQSNNLNVELKNIKFADHKNYLRQIVEFSVEDIHHNFITLKPENRLYKTENALSQEADIFSFLTHDLYAVLSQVDGKTIHAEIYYRPLISLIWFSIFMIFSAFFILLLKK